MQLSLLLILALVTALVALYDGVTRVRGKRGTNAVAIVEVAAAALLGVSIFVPLPAPLSMQLFSIVLEVALIVILVIRGGSRRVATVTIIALILNTVLVLQLLGWLNIPFLS